MKRLNDLPRTANEMLGGLEAGSALKHRILNQAAGKTAPVRRIRLRSDSQSYHCVYS